MKEGLKPPTEQSLKFLLLESIEIKFSCVEFRVKLFSISFKVSVKFYVEFEECFYPIFITLFSKFYN